MLFAQVPGAGVGAALAAAASASVFAKSSGLVSSKVFEVVPPKVEYSLSGLVQVFIEPLRAIYDQAERMRRS